MAITLASKRYTLLPYGTTLDSRVPLGDNGFQYYISPSGDDNNAGSLASPWSITALNTKMATYRGKRVGLLPGTIQYGRVGGVATSLYSLLNAGAGNTPILCIDGGTIAASTVIGSSDADGYYSARTCTIDARNPADDAYATPERALIGQSPNTVSTPSDNLTQGGYVTWDGVNLKGTVYRGLMFYRLAGVTGIIIRNSHFDGGRCATSNNNPGAIYFQAGTDCVVRNCKIHDFQTLGGTLFPWGMAGIMSFDVTNLLVENCTIYDSGGIDGKNSSQSATIRYNYIDLGSFGSGNNNGYVESITDMTAGTGKTNYIHHNIMLGGRRGNSQTATEADGTEHFYNNTVYIPATPYYFYTRRQLATGSRLHVYNNVFWSTGATGGDPMWFAAIAITGTIAETFDYNAYKSDVLFAPNGYSDYGRNLVSWQGYGSYGFDANAISLSATPFASTPSALNISSFDVAGSLLTGSDVGGVMGANDGTGTVGADW